MSYAYISLEYINKNGRKWDSNPYSVP